MERPAGVKDKYRDIGYSIVRTGASSWEWSLHLGAPTVLEMGSASSEHDAVMQARQIIDEALQELSLTDQN
jgi:hypothetical protein